MSYENGKHEHFDSVSILSVLGLVEIRLHSY